MVKKKKHSVRKKSKTDRDRLSVQVIPDKKKQQNKKKCRKRVENDQ